MKRTMIAAISREMLGGIALINPSQHYVLDLVKIRHDYRNIIVSNNHIDARGARIHIALPMGGPCWHQNFHDTTLVGATIENNILTGKAAAYGFIANGIDEFSIQGNVSQATHSGIGEGLWQNLPDPAAAFLYDPNTIDNSQLQCEFKPMKRHLIHLIRAFGKPTNELGYRTIDYGTAEVEAVIQIAFKEMLGRSASSTEMNDWRERMQNSFATSQDLRRSLMTSPEFTPRWDIPKPTTVQAYRTQLWMKAIQLTWQEQTTKEKPWPGAKKLFQGLISRIMSHE